MNLVEAVVDAFGRYSTFAGRTRRADYWWFVLFLLLVYGLAYLLDTATDVPIFGVFALLALILPSLSLTVRRLHDSGRAGSWVLIALIPVVGGLGLLFMTAQRGDAGENRYGPAPEKSRW